MSFRLLVCALLAVAGCSRTAQVRPDEAPVTAQPQTPRAVVEASSAEKSVVDEVAVSREVARNIAPPVVLFGFNSTELSSSERDRLAAWATFIREAGTLKEAVTIVIEGHADERGTEEYNLVLGEKRASSVRSYLARMGVDASKMKTVSYGESRPVRHEQTEEAYAANRRAEVKVGPASTKTPVGKPVAGR